VDANHGAIVDGLRAAGCTVESLAAVGNGCPDLLCGVGGHNVLIEVKVPGERLNNVQKPWHAAWRGRAHIAYSLEQALAIVAHYRAAA
jgi:hypothetical protein